MQVTTVCLINGLPLHALTKASASSGCSRASSSCADGSGSVGRTRGSVGAHAVQRARLPGRCHQQKTWRICLLLALTLSTPDRKPDANVPCA
eukprot:6185585-Pleurochrysis_carterae.AAC.1